MKHRHPRTWLAIMAVALASTVLTSTPLWACGGTVICVDGDAPGPSENGQSWGTAYKYLQDALAAATTGNEIWVAEGVYYPDRGGGQTVGNRTASFFLKSGVAIYGGFAGTETLRTQRNWTDHSTVLSGDLAGDDTADAHHIVLDWSNVAGTDNTYQIVTAGYWSGMDVTVDATAVLDGFTITAGLDLRDEGDPLKGIGAGIIAYKSNPTLSHLVFRGNKATVGGGIYFWEGSATVALSDLSFIGNTATQGGGLYCRAVPVTLDTFLFQHNVTGNLTSAVQSGGGMAADGSLTLSNGQFIGNTSGNAGGLSTNGGSVSLSQVVFDGNVATESNSGAGGMVSEAGSPILTDVTFVNNSSNGWGGAYYHQNSNLTLTRVKFITNTTSWAHGGGFAAVAAAKVRITDSLFAGNQAAGQGGGLYLSSDNLTMTNAAFQGNYASGGGGGFYVYTASANVLNATASGNRVDYGGGGGIYLNSSGSSRISNSIVYGNAGGEISLSGTTDITYSIVSGGCPGSATCDNILDADPAFILPVVAADAPTATGDLRLSLTSPAIDAGDNTLVTAATDLDENPRFVDTSAVVDTGSGTAPLVDMGAYEYPGKPDLSVSKANTVGGVVAANTPFTWNLTISNTGGEAAVFAANTVILQDDLPSANASYGASASIQNASGLSGPINCTVSAYTLTCRANGGPVTLAGPGQFTVAVPVNTSGTPTLTNPRSGGVCKVDPNNVSAELNENNNVCNSDSVAVGQTTLTAALHNAAHTVITNAPAGEAIHASMAVSGASAGGTPTGSITFYRWTSSATCDGSPDATDTQTLAGGAAESASFAAASFYYRVSYSGDSKHEAVTSPCTQFTAYQPGPEFFVNTIADDDSSVDGYQCSDIHCTLREAILAANAATEDNNSILFAIGTGQTITLASALPAINNDNSTLTIDGQTNDITISGADQYRPFHVNNNAQATLANLTIEHGNYTGGDCGLRSCGGGLKIEAGAKATLTHCAILNSTATGSGGGIYNLGELTMTQSTLARNSADEGGGILNGGTSVLTQSTLDNNTSLYGGGILMVAGSLEITNSTLSGNTATGTNSSGGGGALDLYSGAASVITSSTISGNTAVSPNQAKSGIWLENGTLTLKNSIVAGNNGANNFYRTGGTFTSEGYNLADAWNGLSNQSTDLTADPRLGLMADNGGPTQTMALLAGSPAVEAIPGPGCNGAPATDQTGKARPQGTDCDMGAYEFPVVATSTALNSSLNPSLYGQSVTFTATVSPAPAGGTIDFLNNGSIISGCGAQAVSSGQATCVTSGLSTGAHSMTAVFSGNATDGGSTSDALVQTVNQAPAITSAGSATFTAGAAGSFAVTATGYPAPALSLAGALPSGVTFVDNGNGAATLSGTPAAGSGGLYSLTVTAANGVLPAATQNFTLTVNQAPAITSQAAVSFVAGNPSSFTVTATGYPAPALSLTGALPSGVTFADNGNGTATLVGTPAAGITGSYGLAVTAANGVSPDAVQNFTLSIELPPAVALINSIADTGDGQISEGEQTGTVITQLLVVFNKDMNATDAQNAANYSLVRDGSTGIAIGSIVYNNAARTAAFAVNGGAGLPCGSYALTVSAAVSDTLGAPIGSDVVRTFAVLQPDLTITGISSTPACTADSTFTGMSVTVANTGSAAATGAVVQLTSDCGLTFADQTVDLAPGASQELMFPGSIATCACAFTALIDPADAVVECSEADNTLASGPELSIPDLAVDNTTLELACADNGSLWLQGSITLRNSGCGPALTSDVPLAVSFHDGPGCSGALTAQLQLSLEAVDIAAGASQSFTIARQELASDFCTTANHDDVSARINVDDNQTICEWSGDNNTSCSDMTVSGLADTVRCRFSLDAAQASFGPEGGDAAVRVTASDTGCPWTASSAADWITVTAATGSDNGTVSFTVAENSGASRTGTIAIAGKTFTVPQENGCRLTITPEKIQSFLWGSNRAQEKADDMVLLQADDDIDFSLVIALLNLFRYAGPLKLFMVQRDESTEFTSKDRPQWSPEKIKTLMRMRLGRRTMLVLTWIQPFKAKAGPYRLTIGDCSGTITVEDL